MHHTQHQQVPGTPAPPSYYPQPALMHPHQQMHPPQQMQGPVQHVPMQMPHYQPQQVHVPPTLPGAAQYPHPHPGSQAWPPQNMPGPNAPTGPQPIPRFQQPQQGLTGMPGHRPAMGAMGMQAATNSAGLATWGACQGGGPAPQPGQYAGSVQSGAAAGPAASYTNYVPQAPVVMPQAAGTAPMGAGGPGAQSMQGFRGMQSGGGRAQASRFNPGSIA